MLFNLAAWDLIMGISRRHLGHRSGSLESITNAVFISDTEGRFIDFNEA
jgi:hypothetical protein